MYVCALLSSPIREDSRSRLYENRAGSAVFNFIRTSYKRRRYLPSSSLSLYMYLMLGL